MPAQRSKPAGDMSTTAGVAMAPASSPPARDATEKTTRITVDLPLSLHRTLKRDATQMAEDLDRGRVTTQDIVSALVELMTESADLRTDVREWIKTKN